MTTASNIVLISYEEQLPSCYRCNGTGQYQDCPSRKKVKPILYTMPTTSWADIVIQGTSDIVPKLSRTYSTLNRFAAAMAKRWHKYTTTWEEITGSRNASDNRNTDVNNLRGQQGHSTGGRTNWEHDMVTDGPCNNTEDTRAIHERQEAKTIPPYVPNSQTSVKKEQNANKTQNPGLQVSG